MNNKLIFLRHGLVKKDPNKPVIEWELTKQSLEKVKKLKLPKIDIFLASTENKALQTLQPITKEIKQLKGLCEIDRNNQKSLPEQEFIETKRKTLENWNYTKYNWETSNDALNRYKETIEQINKKYQNKTILICSHATVITIYFAYLLNKQKESFERWKSLGFLDYGIVENGKVVKDIVKDQL